MFETMVRNLGPLAWVFAILVGLGVLFTPDSPTVMKLLALLSIASGASAYMLSKSES